MGVPVYLQVGTLETNILIILPFVMCNLPSAAVVHGNNPFPVIHPVPLSGTSTTTITGFTVRNGASHARDFVPISDNPLQPWRINPTKLLAVGSYNYDRSTYVDIT